MKTRTSEIHIRLTEDEKQTMTEKAIKAGLSREEFCRRVLNGATVKEAPTMDVRLLLREMRRIGGNINRILARSYSVGFIDTVQLKKDLVDLRQVRKVIINAYTK